MSVGPITQRSSGLEAVRERVDLTLATFLLEVRAETEAVAPDATLPIDEIRRMIAAGGKRLRPTVCYWGFRAAGGTDGEPVVRVAAALELLHTMALIHDDLMDAAVERRGVPASALELTEQARRRGSSDPVRTGTALAILAGDLAAVLADRLFLSSGFTADRLVPALDRYHRMRTDMAAGQSLDVLGVGDADRSLVASLKSGGYTVSGPLAIGATLAGAAADVLEALRAYGDPLGIAFQMRDDERDGDEVALPEEVATLVERARRALDVAGIDADARRALLALADAVETG
jgi:geranylgeranyl diphosphate synthase, type I